MPSLSVGTKVRIDIPDECDPDYEQFHGAHGEIVRVLSDDLGAVTGDGEDSQIYRVKLDTGEQADFRERDLRPPIEEQ